ncbi:MAG: Stp1/IreP family PP2C-type Ser/Thr phosphatase [Prochloron sp. SP5CPC1]|nr:Stp1/IreP family PP2C-type Ser/Thr phosphatase [Candidatus Paraprochloron terpiosi SP5CPC1]
MKLCFTSQTDTGIVRSVNQDYYYIDPEGCFFIVADGMGGHAGGQDASQIATNTIKAYLEQYWDDSYSSGDLLTNAITEANKEILKDQYNHPERGDMGTTAVVLLFRQEQQWCAHIGDSRLYLLRGELNQITEDHTWVARALKSGDITAEQARFHPGRHVLSQCLGRKDLQLPSLQHLELQVGDILLLCSDGLTEEVPDEQIQDYLQSSSSCEEKAAQLIEGAKKAGGSDNITVVLVALLG